MKYINFKRYKFSTAIKNLNTLRYNFVKFFKTLVFSLNNFKKFFKNLDINRFKTTKFIKNLDLRRFGTNYFKKINLKNSKFLIIHLPASIIFFGFLYILMPTFYNYDKAEIEKIICTSNNIKCLIKGKITYRFFPSPRLKIKDLIINGFAEKKKTLITAKDVSIKLSLKNLLAKDQHKFTKIKLSNFKTNLNLKNLKKYKNIFKKDIALVPVIFEKGEIIFFDENKQVFSITDTNIKSLFKKDTVDFDLKGKFLNDNIYIKLNSSRKNNSISTDLILKMSNLNFLTKANFIDLEKEKKISGNFLVKKDKHRIAGIFDYLNNELVIQKSNLKNYFLDGTLSGKIIFIPYFDFNLEMNLNSINFTRLFNYFLSIDMDKQKELFKINNKINGKLSLSADKVHARHDFVNSFESRMNFNNGSIDIDQFLINFGKLGAADLLAKIENDEKFTNLKFESNIFVDNEKKFLNKLGIYNKENTSSNFFISGSFDLQDPKMTFFEISDEEKFNAEDINYIENEFNDLILEEGYKNLFNFPKFKVFLKSIISEKN
tara:strand:- start:3906 stop:5540 length:1635 start_codon:yes stop_codon:yes gene_type:complete